jgi:DNA-binding CsgD family transcriptional regulator
MGPAGPGRYEDVLFERDVELKAIGQALAAAMAGEGSVMLIEGPAGIGKTALLGAARHRAEREGLVVLPARGSELEAGFPYGVVRQLLEPAVRNAGHERRGQLFAGAAELARSAVVGPATASANPARQMFAVVHGLFWLVANLAADVPLALLLDDVHLADPPSLRFVAYLARRLDGLRIAVLGSARTGEPGIDPALVGQLESTPGTEVLSLSPLSEVGVASLLVREFGQEPDAEFARSCVAATGGIPLYVRELAALLRADEVAPTADAAMRIANAAPATIAQATLALLGRLSDDAMALACAIAVLDGEAELPRAARVARLDQRRSLAALDALTGAKLIQGTSRLEFRHPIVRAAIYNELSEGARSSSHQQAAAILASEGAMIDTIAGHLLQTQPTGSLETIGTLREAASHALAVGAPDAAARYLARALEEGPGRELRKTLLLELGLAEQLTVQPTASARFDEVIRLADDPATRATAMISQSVIALYSGDWETMMDSLDGALSELAAEDGALRIHVETLRATASMYDPRTVHAFEERLPILEQLVARRAPGTRPLAWVLAAWGSQRDQPPERIRALVEQGWDGGHYLEQGEPIEPLPQGIHSARMIDELELASSIIERSLAVARRSGSVMHYLLSSSDEAMLETWRGNLSVVAAELPGWLERVQELRLPMMVAAMLWYCSDAIAERPDLAAFADLTRTLDLGPLADTQTGALIFEARARLRHADGDTTAAIDDLRRAGAIHTALRSTNPPGCIAWRSTLALMLGPDSRDEALTLAEAELTDARRRGQPRRVGIALRTLGLLHGDTTLLQDAVTTLADSPAKLEQATALVELGAAQRRAGNRAAARAPLRDGLDLATRCGATRLAARARTELVATGARPRRAHISGRDSLTPSELRVARMAAEGRTNNEIAQALFVTTRTIDAHLAHTYTKLGINSRRQLENALAEFTSH